MIRRKFISTLVLSVLLCFAAAAQDFSAGALLYPGQADSSDVAAGWRFRSEDRARVVQEGRGLSEGFFDAHTLLHLSGHSALRGSATYRRGVKRGVRWNSTSDFDLLFPYVLADSVGGDLQTETYAFGGAYARRLGDWTAGLSGNYRALHEYRQVDPRPRNITSDFEVDASGGRVLGAYALDLTLGYRRYFQSQTVSFINQRGANTTEFHMTGLGSHFGRFMGTSAYTSTYYRGQGFRAGASFSALSDDGWRGSVFFSHTAFVRHLVNQNQAPITRLGVSRLTASLYWLSHRGNDLLQAGGDVACSLRSGSENVISNMSTGSFGTLMSLPMYERKSLDARIFGDYHHPVDTRSGFALRPTLYVRASRAEHVYPARLAEMLVLAGTVRAGYDRTFPSSWRLDAGLTAGVAASPAHDLSLPEAHTMPRLLEDMRLQYGVLTDTRADAGADVRISRSAGGKMRVYLRGIYLRSFYAGGYAARHAACAVGLCF